MINSVKQNDIGVPERPTTYGKPEIDIETSGIDTKTLDLESLMIYVKSKFVDLMEKQLRQQLEEVQRRNETNVKLNQALTDAIAIQNTLKSDAKADTAIGEDGFKVGQAFAESVKNAGMDSQIFAEKAKKEGDLKKAKDALGDLTNKEASLTKKRADLLANSKNFDKNGFLNDKAQNEKMKIDSEELPKVRADIATKKQNILDLENSVKGIFSKATTKGDIDTAITKIKGQIDANNSTNQMDMLRLQTLNSRRNEAFDLMSNFVKKMLDSRLSIISNMR
ncbi:MAG: hypothetical protein I8H77_14485 [Comamonadaceae bacterium]|nr:hypothetical protein [Comamonadaceae bacterium]